VRQAKLGAPCRVKVPVGKGLTNHPYRVLRLKWGQALVIEMGSEMGSGLSYCEKWGQNGVRLELLSYMYDTDIVFCMARKPRIHVAGGLYHVMLRGNGGDDIFFIDEDRYRFYLLMQEGLERFGHRIHGFCCMTNHVHMAIQVSDIPLSKIMQNLSFRYTRWINQREKRIGHLFQGRYKAILVDGDSYLLELVRYIHLNPVRAGMVNDPIEYQWSGHRAYLGEEHLPWLTTDWVLSQFGRQRTVAKRRYSKFIQEGEGAGHREEFHRGGEDSRVLGEDRFLNRVLKAEPKRCKPPSIKKIVQVVCRHYGIKEHDLASPSRQRQLAEIRGVVAWLVMHNESGTLTELTHRFKRDLSALSLAARKIESKRKESRPFNKALQDVANLITQA